MKLVQVMAASRCLGSIRTRPPMCHPIMKKIPYHRAFLEGGPSIDLLVSEDSIRVKFSRCLEGTGTHSNHRQQELAENRRITGQRRTKSASSRIGTATPPSAAAKNGLLTIPQKRRPPCARPPRRPRHQTSLSQQRGAWLQATLA